MLMTVRWSNGQMVTPTYLHTHLLTYSPCPPPRRGVLVTPFDPNHTTPGSARLYNG